MGTQLPPKRCSAQFSANVHCGQTAGWTKMPLGMEVGLGPGDFVFDWDPATPEKMAHPPPPNFRLMSIVAKWLEFWIKMPHGTEVDLGPCHIVLDGSQLSMKGAQQPPSFVSIVATVPHLSYCWALVAQLMAESPYTLQWAPLSQNYPFPWGTWTPIPSNLWFLGPVQAHKPNGITIGSAIFAQWPQCPYTL